MIRMVPGGADNNDPKALCVPCGSKHQAVILLDSLEFSNAKDAVGALLTSRTMLVLYFFFLSFLCQYQRIRAYDIFIVVADIFLYHIFVPFGVVSVLDLKVLEVCSGSSLFSWQLVSDDM